MKKIIAGLISACLLAASCVGAFAAEKPYMVYGDREVVTIETECEYVNGVYMMPVRMLCKLANAKCDWYEDTKGIIVNSKDNVTRLFMYIGNDTLRIFTFTSVADGVAEEVPLKAPIKIVNDRTLVPFEQIADALKLKYEWSDDKKVLKIQSDEVITDDPKVEMSIETDKQDVNKGDEVVVSVKGSNMMLYDGYSVSVVSAGIIYDPSKFEFVGGQMTSYDGQPIESTAVENPHLTNDSMKFIYMQVNGTKVVEDKATVATLRFKALTDDGGSFRLSDRLNERAYDTSLIFTNLSDYKDSPFLEKASVLKINTDEVTVK